MTDGVEWYGGYTTVSRSDGVVVEKGIDLETIPLPAIKLRIRSERDEPVGLVVAEQLPGEVPAENVGFHPDHGVADWHVTGRSELTWTARVDPDEEIVTCYGVWLEEGRQIYGFLDPPLIERVVDLEPDTDWAPTVEGARDKNVLDRSLATSKPESMRRLVTAVDEALAGIGTSEAETDSGAATEVGDGDDPTEDAEEDLGFEDVFETAVAEEGSPEDDDASRISMTPGDANHRPTWPEDGSEAVERGGEAELELPRQEEVEALVEDPAPSAADRYFVRATLADGHRGGGASTVLQELRHAMTVLGRRVDSAGPDAERLDAAVVTEHRMNSVVRAIAARELVVDVLVLRLGTADPEAGEGVSEFELLQDEIDPLATEELEAELAELSLPGLDTDDEVSLSELVERHAEPEYTVGSAGDEAAAARDRRIAELEIEVRRLRERVAELEDALREATDGEQPEALQQRGD